MNPIEITLAASTYQNTSFYSSYTFLIIIVLIVFARLIRNASGRRFSERRLFTLPIMLLVITLFGLIDIPIGYYLYFAALIVVGLLPGLRWGEGGSVYSVDGKLMYRRSSVVLALWAASLIARIAIEIAFPGNLNALVIVEGILSFESGMIIGESNRLWRKYRDAVSTLTTQSSQ